MKLQPISYTWRDRPESRTRLGLIAQEVQPVLIKAVQEQQEQIEELKAEIEELKSETNK